MRKLLILSVLLMTFVVHAVPVDADVGAGSVVAIDESGGQSIVSAIVALEPIGVGELNPTRTYQTTQGIEPYVILVNGQTYTAKYGVVTVLPLTSQRNHTMRTTTVILRC